MPAPTGSPGARTKAHQHLRAWREAAGLSLQQFAEAVGRQSGDDTRYSAPYFRLRRWETGERKMTVDDLADLAGFYGVEPWDLLRGGPPDGWVWKPAPRRRKAAKKPRAKAVDMAPPGQATP